VIVTSRDTWLWWAEISDCDEQRYAIVTSRDIYDCDVQRYAIVTSRAMRFWRAEIRDCDKQRYAIVTSRDMRLWRAEIPDCDKQRYAIVTSRDMRFESVKSKTTWLFVLYVKWLGFCVVWANGMNGLLCWTLNDLSCVLFEQVDWTDWLLCCTLNYSTFEQNDWIDLTWRKTTFCDVR
jgi:hypothetical protein